MRGLLHFDGNFLVHSLDTAPIDLAEAALADLALELDLILGTFLTVTILSEGDIVVVSLVHA